ncbi:MAG: hypothetical protein R3F44_01360 [Candidatus Competibacteraceae bacterium]
MADKIKKTLGHTAHHVVLPTVVFHPQLLVQNETLNGWAAINSAVAVFYVFLKYAKLYEHYRLLSTEPGCCRKTLRRRRSTINPRMPRFREN